MGSLSLLQGIVPTQKSNQGLLHCRQILYQLSNEVGAKKNRLPDYPSAISVCVSGACLYYSQYLVMT